MMPLSNDADWRDCMVIVEVSLDTELFEVAELYSGDRLDRSLSGGMSAWSLSRSTRKGLFESVEVLQRRWLL